MTANTDLDLIREAVAETVNDIIGDCDRDTDRETLIERLDEECDSLWGRLVSHGRIDQWDADDLAAHAGECAAILKLAKADAWVEDDAGLWEGLTFGVLPSMAYFSLRNLLYQAMKDAGHDSNDDRPFDKGSEEDAGDEIND
jgi:hypothetical protein